MVGVVTRGGLSGSLAPLGIPGDIALAPFAARYRVADFAHATLRNSGLPERAVPRAAAASAAGGRSIPRPGARLLPALQSAGQQARTEPPGPVVVLVADHVLDADLRPALAEHQTTGADLALLCVPAGATSGGSCLLQPDATGAVSVARDDTGEDDPFALAWTGDLIVRSGRLPALLSTIERSTASHDATLIAALARRHRVLAHDLLAAAPAERRPYWHEPRSVEAYYGAHMDLCTESPRLDLYDPGWPVVGTSESLPPAKVVSAEASHAGQALDALLGDGAVIRGGAVIRSVVGRSVLVEVGAEIEDSLLLDGCRIGRGARVRRAIVGAGAVVGDGEQVGYDDDAPTAAITRRLPSGLTLVLPAPAAFRLPAVAR